MISSVVIANPGQGTSVYGQANFYGRYGSKISDLVTSHLLLEIENTATGNDVADLVNGWRFAVGKDSWPTWSVSITNRVSRLSTILKLFAVSLVLFYLFLEKLTFY